MTVLPEDNEPITYVPQRIKFKSILNQKKYYNNKSKVRNAKETAVRLLFIFAKRFIAGESLEEALPVIRKKKKEGFFTTTDILGESVASADDAKNKAEEYCSLIKTLKDEGLDKNISIKLTQLGLDISTQLCYENVCKILDVASANDTFIRVDMEGSAYTERTLELVHRWHEGYPKVGAVIQSMLKRSPRDVEKLIKSGISVRLCKGAYKEPYDIAFKRRTDVDFQYAEITSHLLSSGIYHGIATHDEKLINHVKEYVTYHGLSKDSFEFQMLLGIRSKLQRDLVKEGWKVRLYCPFGNSWLPYTLRRLRERKENLWFVAKNLVRR